ncbi:MAG TPA: hypothetical protein VHT91_23125 [Kofleriaceae bacterium]|jgi:hypothetical protein|nr:hypothetical protein [Kofleriaceae bacterium]
MLHTALATAPDRPMVHVAAVVAGIALTGAGLVFATSALIAADEPGAHRAPAPPALSIPSEPAVAPVAAALPAGPEPLALVFRAGDASYLSIADLPDGDGHATPLQTPPHGALQRSRDRDGVTAAIATVAEQDVPADQLRWLGRRVDVDDVCTATVIGFAVVARQQRTPGRIALPADAVLRSGHAVLAARLDRCTGSYARELAPL